MKRFVILSSLLFFVACSAHAQVFYTLDSLFKSFSYMQVALQELPETQHRRDSASYRGAIHFDYCDDALYSLLEDLLLDGDSTARLRDTRKRLEESNLATGSTFLVEFERLTLSWCPLLRAYRSYEVDLYTLMGYDCRHVELRIQFLMGFDEVSKQPKLELCIIHPSSQRWYYLSYAHDELSGLSNRTAFNERFEKCLQRYAIIETSDGGEIDYETTLNKDVQAFWRRWNWSCE